MVSFRPEAATEKFNTLPMHLVQDFDVSGLLLPLLHVGFTLTGYE